MLKTGEEMGYGYSMIEALNTAANSAASYGAYCSSQAMAWVSGEEGLEKALHASRQIWQSPWDSCSLNCYAAAGLVAGAVAIHLFAHAYFKRQKSSAMSSQEVEAFKATIANLQREVAEQKEIGPFKAMIAELQKEVKEQQEMISLLAINMLGAFKDFLQQQRDQTRLLDALKECFHLQPLPQLALDALNEE